MSVFLCSPVLGHIDTIVEVLFGGLEEGGSIIVVPKKGTATYTTTLTKHLHRYIGSFLWPQEPQSHRLLIVLLQESLEDRIGYSLLLSL